MAGLLGDPVTNAILAGLLKPVRRKIFVSYHHGGDQVYYDEFSRFFHEQFEAVFDNSLERQVDSDNVNYVMQRIRDNHISGTSCTVVLIGAQTHQRKYVDWEIKATLDKEHGLLGVILPNHQKSIDGKIMVPDRFFENFTTGYALFEHWGNLTVQRLTALIDAAAKTPKSLIANSAGIKQRNG